MTETDKLIEKIIQNLEQPNVVRPEDIPNIDLYMDQLTTFMDKYLGGCKRNPEDKILTKTMINNYAKNRLLPPPEKKKYTQEHLIILIMIYYMKGFLSINDIQVLVTPLIEKHFSEEDDTDLKAMYSTMFQLANERIGNWKEELADLDQLAKTVFEKGGEDEVLHSFSLICLLSMDVYLRKRAIEALIDNLSERNAPQEPSPEEKKEKKKK